MARNRLDPRARRWVEAYAPSPVTTIGPVGGGFTETKRLVHLADGEPLVLRWADPVVWGATGREHAGNGPPLH